MPEPPWRTAVSLVDTRKWQTKHFRPDLVEWVRKTCQEKGMEELQRNLGMRVERPRVMTAEMDDSPDDDDDEDAHDVRIEVQEGEDDEEESLPQEGSGFRFFSQMTPAGQRLRREIRKGRPTKGKGHHMVPDGIPVVPPPPKGTPPVLSENWEEAYSRSEEFSGMWAETQDPTIPWPIGVQLHVGKMYFLGRLCVPEEYLHRVPWEFHKASGHLGVARKLK